MDLPFLFLRDKYVGGFKDLRREVEKELSAMD
jgi:hypothetical protein